MLNRHAFYSLMGAARDEKKRPLGGTVAIIDIDNLKPLNDTFGHAAGDVAIRAVAKAVRSIIRAEDLLFRWGGDEFLVILPHVDYAEATERLEKLDNLLMRITCRGRHRWRSPCLWGLPTSRRASVSSRPSKTRIEDVCPQDAEEDHGEQHRQASHRDVGTSRWCGRHAHAAAWACGLAAIFMATPKRGHASNTTTPGRSLLALDFTCSRGYIRGGDA